MKKLLLILLCIFVLCSCDNTSYNKKTGSGKVSFTAFINEGENFQFEFNPSEEVTYEFLRENEFDDVLSIDNWNKYFKVSEVYREHYELDESGNTSQTFMKGKYYTVGLVDDYYFVDNWTRNGLVFNVFVDGYETRIMTNNGITYDPVTTEYNEEKDFAGADSMLILSDFIDSWDDMTYETYSGELNSYNMVSCSGDLYLLNSSAIVFKDYKDGIKYFAACGDNGEFYVILLKTDDVTIDTYKEYEGAVYVMQDGYEKPYRYDGYKRIIVWEMIVDLMKYANS